MKDQKTTIAITGASGFFGSHIRDQAVAAGLQVRAVIRNTSSTQWLDPSADEIVRANLLDSDALVPAFRGVSVVVHNAGALWGDYHRINVDGTVCVLSAAKRAGVKRFVFISSIAAEGPCTGKHLREIPDDSDPLTRYGRSKRLAEYIVQGTENIDVRILRFPMIFGPRDKQTIRIFSLARRGLIVDLGPARRYISTIYAPDAARAVIAACRIDGLSGMRVFVSDGDVRCFGEISAEAARAVGMFGIPLRVPYFLISLYSAVADSLGIEEMALNPEQLSMFRHRFWLVGNREVKRKLEWLPQNDFKTAMKETCRWYRREGWL